MAHSTHDKSTARRLAEQLNQWSTKRESDTAPTRLLEAGDGRAVAEARVTGQAGIASPATVLTLGNAAARAASVSALCAGREPSPDRTPLTLQLSVNLFRDAGRGTLTASAETIYRGRATLIVDVKVRDEQKALVATLVVTHLAPREAVPRAHEVPARLAS